jgi:hypothetical protein
MRKTERRTCLETGGDGSGAHARQASVKTKRGGSGGTTMPSPRTTLEIGAVNAWLDWPDCACSDEAQQLSACAWVTVRAAVDPSDCPLCIGHGRPSLQHVMRASGVAAHPSQTAAFPAATRTVSARANNRRLKVSTGLGCWTLPLLSNRALETVDLNRAQFSA